MASANDLPRPNIPRAPLPRFQLFANIPTYTKLSRSSSMNRLPEGKDSSEAETINKINAGETPIPDTETDKKPVHASVESATSNQLTRQETSSNAIPSMSNETEKKINPKSSHHSIVSQPSFTENEDLNISSSVDDTEIQAATSAHVQSVSRFAEVAVPTSNIKPATVERRTRRSDSLTPSSDIRITNSLPDQPVTFQNNAANLLDLSSLLNFQQFFQRYIKPMPIPTIEGFSATKVAFIHLDPYVNELPSYYFDIIGPVLVDYCVRDIEACVSLVKTYHTDKRIFLINTGGIAKDLVPKLHSLNQIHAIYIHCENVQYHRQWTKEFKKVRVVCSDDRKELLPVLATDLAFVYEFHGDLLLKKKNHDGAQKRYRKAFKILQNITHDPQWSESIQGKLLSLEE